MDSYRSIRSPLCKNHIPVNSETGVRIVKKYMKNIRGGSHSGEILILEDGWLVDPTSDATINAHNLRRMQKKLVGDCDNNSKRPRSRINCNPKKLVKEHREQQQKQKKREEKKRSPKKRKIQGPPSRSNPPRKKTKTVKKSVAAKKKKSAKQTRTVSSPRRAVRRLSESR